MKSREINGERKLKGAAEATKRPTLKWADAHWILHSCFIGSLWMQMWERQKDQRNALLRGCNCTLSRHKTSSKFTASVFNTGRVAHRWTFASNYFEYYCNSTRYTVCTACWRRSRYILDTRIRVYQISISLCEVICRVSDSFWFRHAVRARSFQPKRDSFFSLRTARNAVRRSDITLPWIFRIPISGLLLSRGLYTRHWSRITRVIALRCARRSVKTAIWDVNLRETLVLFFYSFM